MPTAFRTPDGAFRIFSKKTEGIVTLNAESTERRVKPSDAELEVAPGQLLTDNLRWRLLKKHYLIDLANPVGALDREGRPIIIVPYVSYKGWLIRRPVLGGVFVVHPDGEIEDLSPDEARIVLSRHGALFRTRCRAQEVASSVNLGTGSSCRGADPDRDTEINQPVPIDSGRWHQVGTVGEPYGQALRPTRSSSPTVTGEPRSGESRARSLSAPRAVQTVRSVSIPAWCFAGEERGTGEF